MGSSICTEFQLTEGSQIHMGGCEYVPTQLKEEQLLSISSEISAACDLPMNW